jgi:hypothetical protein
LGATQEATKARLNQPVNNIISSSAQQRIYTFLFRVSSGQKQIPCNLTIIWANTTNKRNPIDLADSININTHGYQRRLCTSFSYHALCGEHNIAGDQP